MHLTLPPLLLLKDAALNQEHKTTLSQVLWIGGATDAGKTTVSHIIARRLGFQIYDYDRRDLPQIKRLAQSNLTYQAFLTASVEERWVRPEPEELLQLTLQAFRDRFPLVIEEILDLPREPMVVAEGHGFIPELVAPVLLSKHQAIWLVPAEEFKKDSMKRRNKPSFRSKTSDPERATRNVFMRDMLLAELVKAQVRMLGLTVYEIDGSQPAGEIATLVEQHFEPILNKSNGTCQKLRT
jgi:shikimate kinase